MKKTTLFMIIGIAFIGVISFSILGISQKQNLKTLMVNKDTSTKRYSKDIVFDGNHYKIDHPIIGEEAQIYLSLTDLKHIVGLNIKQNDKHITITYEDNKLEYKNGVVQEETGKKGKYKVKDNIIYLPDTHIEKFLGLKVDDYLSGQTATISLTSPKEQQKEKMDQGIGMTVFLHKENVPTAKYEPRNSIYLGGYVLQDEYIQTSMKKFNQLSEKNHASFFKYVGYGKPFPKAWVEDVKSVGGFPHIAWEPNNGLEEVKDDKYLRQFAKDAKEAGIPILLRYASEMNGTWTAYSGDPESFIEKWKLVHDVMEEEAPNVMMLWNVFTMPEETIHNFYPGDQYVDYVGVNIYNVVYHNDKLEEKSDFEDPLRLLDFVYNTYSHKKPIIIGEFGATNYTVTDGLYHVDFAIEKISRIYKYLPKLYPRVKGIYYFDVNNLVNAPEGRKINNYAITENERITNAYAHHIKPKNYLSHVETSPSKDETFSYRDFLFYYKGELFIDSQFVADYLNMEIKKIDAQSANITYHGESFDIHLEELTIDKAAFFEKRTIKGLSIEEILRKWNISYQYKDGDLHISL